MSVIPNFVHNAEIATFVTNHELCAINGCTNAAITSCAKCEHEICSDHKEICEICGLAFCSDCRDPLEHNCQIEYTRCSVDDCTMIASFVCEGCKKEYCADHWGYKEVSCGTCGKSCCVDCLDNHECTEM